MIDGPALALRRAVRPGAVGSRGPAAPPLIIVGSGSRRVGKPIGALQSIQHRLARAYVLSQGTKWLARRAAWDTTDPVAAAAAACYGAEGVREVISTTHQVCGAIGITDEFGLTAYTARMAMLQTELGGAIAHARALAHARWDDRVTAE